MPAVLTVLRFDGPRFEDHGLDVDVLPEILAYKRLLQATAKEIWRREHPDKQRLPKGFVDNISLKFFEIVRGSTSIPLVREFAPSRPYPMFEDELGAAARLLQMTIDFASRDDGVPKDLPRAIIPMFGQLGNTLRDDERIFVNSGDFVIGSGSPPVRSACFDHRARENILRWAGDAKYSDAIELVGEVRATDLDGQKFTLKVQDGSKVIINFRPEHEQTVLEALGEHSSVRLKVHGVGEFNPDDGSLQQIVEVDHFELTKTGKPEPVKEPPIWERLASIAKTVPDDVWQNVPADLSANLDKYLYGKKDPH